MSLNGAGLRFLETVTIPTGFPGGVVDVTIRAQPLGSYPALGEPIATLLTALWALPSSEPHVHVGVVPSQVWISSSLSQKWDFDPAQGTMGSIRKWDAIGTLLAEHATGVYDALELLSILSITMRFPLFGDMSR